MTRLYHPFPLSCFEKLKKHTQSYMERFNKDDLYIKDIPIPAELLDEFNAEMASFNLGGGWNFMCFKRKNFFTETYNVHVDYSHDKGAVNCSIVVPVEGCKDTHMYWATGDYDLETVLLGNTNNIYANPKWKSNPKIVDKVEISTQPFLTRVDVPHSVTSRLDGTYRTILSIRIQGNPRFEDVLLQRF